MNETLAYNSSEIHRIDFLQERNDQISTLFKGTEFRLSSLENEVSNLDNDFKVLCKAQSYENAINIEKYNNDSYAINNKHNKIKQ